MNKTYDEIIELIWHHHEGLEYGNKIMEFCDNDEPFEAVTFIQNSFGCSLEEAQHVVKDVHEFFKNSRAKHSAARKSTPQKDINTPKCPKCGSTAITTGARGVGFFRGFLGANETVNRCGNCAYTWKPSKWL